MTEKDSELNEEMLEQEPLVIYPKGVKVKKKLGAKQIVLIGVIVALVVFIYIPWMYGALLLIGAGLNPNRERDTTSGSTHNSLETEVELYLEERYGEQFVVTFEHGRGYAYDHALLHGYPVDHPDDERYEFEIQVYYYKGGKKEFYDGYTMVKLADEYEEYIDEILGDCFNEYKFHMEFYSEWITTNLPADITLEELWKNYRANADYPLPRIRVLIPPETTPKQIKEFVEKLGQSSFRGVAGIVHHYDKSIYDMWAEDARGEDPDEYFTTDYYNVSVHSDKVECEGRRHTHDGGRERNEEQRNQIMRQIADYGALIIDKTEDGIYTRPVENGIRFWYDEDEYLDRCAYIQEDVHIGQGIFKDALLLLKLDEPDNPYGISKERLIPYELQYSWNEETGRYESINTDYIYVIDSFEFLKKLDDNHDGVLNFKDDSFALLRTWNESRVEMDGDLYPVNPYYLVGGTIDLNVERVDEKDEFGNLICCEGTIQYEEGEFPYKDDPYGRAALEDMIGPREIEYRHTKEAVLGIREYRFERLTSED